MTLSIRGFSFAGLILLLGIIGQWFGYFTEYLWLVPSVFYLWLLSLEYVDHPECKVKFQLTAITNVCPGDLIQQQLVITNLSRGDIFVEYQLDFCKAVAGKSVIQHQFIAANSHVNNKIHYMPLALGEISPADYHVRVLGRYGFAWWQKHIKNEEVINVIPSRAMGKASRAGLQREGLRVSKNRVSAGFELLSHREYQQGDSLQSIDWKASARRRQKMVRIMSHEQRIELVILLDCGRTSQLQAGDLSQLLHNVNIAARLSDLALQYGDHVGCIRYADKPLAVMPLNSGNKARQQLQVLLKKSTAQKTESNLLMAALQARRLLGHRGLVVVLTDLHSGDLHSQFAQAVRLLSEKHETLIASLDDQSILDMRWAAASHWLDPYKNLSAIEFVRERKLIKTRLRQLGANVVTASPNTLDQAVMKYYQRRRLGAII
ncbi:hypothetical protein MNBD_GAMMA06-773 [hydrothermal vent metagenome]|uniref:DUF58 domain-containing protein n=1 Tax=hydrothermal vent metagenome TaxID=652676 RepID=A0A3B0WIS4_9ZZZZ